MQRSTASQLKGNKVKLGCFTKRVYLKILSFGISFMFVLIRICNYEIFGAVLLVLSQTEGEIRKYKDHLVIWFGLTNGMIILG